MWKKKVKINLVSFTLREDWDIYEKKNSNGSRFRCGDRDAGRNRGIDPGRDASPGRCRRGCLHYEGEHPTPLTPRGRDDQRSRRRRLRKCCDERNLCQDDAREGKWPKVAWRRIRQFQHPNWKKQLRYPLLDWCRRISHSHFLGALRSCRLQPLLLDRNHLLGMDLRGMRHFVPRSPPGDHHERWGTGYTNNLDYCQLRAAEAAG